MGLIRDDFSRRLQVARGAWDPTSQVDTAPTGMETQSSSVRSEDRLMTERFKGAFRPMFPPDIRNESTPPFCSGSSKSPPTSALMTLPPFGGEEIGRHVHPDEQGLLQATEQLKALLGQVDPQLGHNRRNMQLGSAANPNSAPLPY